VPSRNLDLARSIYAAQGRGDFSSSEWMHPELEYVIADGPEAGFSTTGRAGLADWGRDYLSAWDELRIEADEFRELDKERVLALDHRSGRAKRSGLDIGQMRTKGAHVFSVRGGKVTRLVAYRDGDRALADLGLTQSTDPGQ
jgi:ketosteroid isomerase-like protein